MPQVRNTPHDNESQGEPPNKDRQEGSSRGYIYILVNPAFTGLVKIGRTVKELYIRAREISQGVGVPAPYQVVWDALVNNHGEVERLIHKELALYRVRNNREFFSLSLKQAISLVERIIAPYACENTLTVELPLASDLPASETATQDQLSPSRQNRRSRRLFSQMQGVASPKAAFWADLAETFNNLGSQLSAPLGGKNSYYLLMPCDVGGIHYEWVMRDKEQRLDIAIHFEAASRELNLRRLQEVEEKQAAITDGVVRAFVCEPWGKTWAHAKFHLPFEGSYSNREAILEAASLMKILVERTLLLMKAMAFE